MSLNETQERWQVFADIGSPEEEALEAKIEATRAAMVDGKHRELGITVKQLEERCLLALVYAVWIRETNEKTLSPDFYKQPEKRQQLMKVRETVIFSNDEEARNRVRERLTTVLDGQEAMALFEAGNPAWVAKAKAMAKSRKTESSQD